MFDQAEAATKQRKKVQRNTDSAKPPDTSICSPHRVVKHLLYKSLVWTGWPQALVHAFLLAPYPGKMTLASCHDIAINNGEEKPNELRRMLVKQSELPGLCGASLLYRVMWHRRHFKKGNLNVYIFIWSSAFILWKMLVETRWDKYDPSLWSLSCSWKKISNMHKSGTRSRRQTGCPRH